MNNLQIEDAGLNFGINVVVTKRDTKTGRVIQQEKGHNKCLKQQLLGIIKFLDGEYNYTTNETEQDYYKWIPRYLGVGTNTATGQQTNITTTVNINDTRLLNEIGPRVQLPQRNKIISRNNQNYMQLVIKTYLPNQLFNNQLISEAGLFSESEGNNCLFRIVFPGIQKDENSIIEVVWTISVISVSSISNPSTVINKEDLRTSIDKILDKCGLLDNRVSAALNLVKNQAIDAAADTSLNQTQINDIVKNLEKEYNKIKNLT